MGTVSTNIVSQVNSFCQHNQATSCRTIVSFPVKSDSIYKDNLRFVSWLSNCQDATFHHHG